jgi:hypothetical protein
MFFICFFICIHKCFSCRRKQCFSKKRKHVCYINGIDLCFSHMDSHESCFSLQIVKCVPQSKQSTTVQTQSPSKSFQKKQTANNQIASSEKVFQKQSPKERIVIIDRAKKAMRNPINTENRFFNILHDT